MKKMGVRKLKLKKNDYAEILYSDIERFPSNGREELFKFALGAFSEIGYGYHWILKKSDISNREWEDGDFEGMFHGIMFKLYTLLNSGQYDEYGGVDYKVEPKITETGSSETKSMSENSPINADLGDIQTPSAKANGGSNYTRTHSKSGYKEDLEAVFMKLEHLSKKNLLSIVRDSFTPFILEFNVVE